MAETRIRLDKQIQKATKTRQVPLSDANGELQYADIDALIKTGETLTRLNSVEITGGALIIKYTPENGVQQVVSTPLVVGQQDIKVSDARMDNPSAGVYRLIISENDGSTFPVDLSALLAVVTQNTGYTTISGNGTPQNPLRVDLTDTFWNSLTKNLYQMEDVVINEGVLEQEVSKGGTTVLIWDNESRRWTPKSVFTLDNFNETTQVFNNLNKGNSVSLAVKINEIIPQSIKVFRNGLRQIFAVDYDFVHQQTGTEISFSEPFSDKLLECVVVDYRPMNYQLVA